MRRLLTPIESLADKGVPQQELGNQPQWASGPPKTMRLVAQAFQPVPGHLRAVSYTSFKELFVTGLKSCHSERGGAKVKNLGGFKREIFAGAPNDKQ